MLLAGIKVCESKGRLSAVAALLERKGLSEDVRAVAEKALIASIEVCEREGRVYAVASLFERKGLNDGIMEKA